MFENLFNFSYKKSPKEAFIFYLTCLFLIWSIGIISGLVIGYVFAFALLPHHYFQAVKLKGIYFYNWGVFLFYISTGLLFLIKKRLFYFSAIFIFVLCIFLSYFAGDIFGLIPATILSTFPNKNISE